MELKWLTDFLVLAKTGSFSQAAIERHVTQPAFSRRIKSLETWLGTDLIDRRSFPVTLTPEGRSFLETAENVSKELHQNRSDFQKMGSSLGSDIRMSIASTLAISFAPQWLNFLRAKTRDFSVGVYTHDFLEMVQLLSDQQVDFVMQFSHPEIPLFFEQHKFDAIKLGHDRMHLCSPTTDNGEALFSLSKAKQLPIRYIGYKQMGYFGKVEDLIFSRMPNHSTLFERHSESGTCEFIKQMAIADRALCWLPACSAHDAVETGKLIPIGDGRYDTGLDIWIYKNKDSSSPLIDAIWAALKEDPCVDHLAHFQLEST